jgi:hypothetical protein
MPEKIGTKSDPGTETRKLEKEPRLAAIPGLTS